MMEGNPNWWSLNNINMRSQASLVSPSSSNFFDNQELHASTPSDSDHTSNSNSYADGQEEFPQSWSQLLMGGMANDQEEDGNYNHPRQLQPGKKMETSDWEYHHETLNPLSNLRFLSVAPSILDVAHQARDVNSYNHSNYDHQQQETLLVLDHTCQSNSSTTDHVSNDNPNSSYESFISNSSSLEIMSNAKRSVVVSRKQQITEHGSTSNKMVTSGGVYKKPRVQSSSQPPLRVRKELGDRITALHQIVSPFGKTDTASVLLEAIGYIRFLQGQIQALVSPYLDTSGILSSNMRHHHPLSVQEGRLNYAFHIDQEDAGGKDLRSKGLCLVPISCINDIESGIKGAADFWVTPAPSLGTGGGGGGGF